MGEILFYLIAFFVIGGVIMLVLNSAAKGLEEKITNSLDQVEMPESFNATQSFSSPDKSQRLAIDEENRKIAVWSYGAPSTVNIYKFKDILAVEILENGITVNQTSQKSQLGGALIGGAIAGGVGAVIGGLSGKSSSSSEINKVDMKIIFNDTKKPYFIINMISKLEDNSNQPIKKGSSIYNSLMERVHHWHSVLGYAIRKSEEEFLNSNSLPQTPNESLANQLKELNELRKKGILSEEEFQQQKIKILNT